MYNTLYQNSATSKLGHLVKTRTKAFRTFSVGLTLPAVRCIRVCQSETESARRFRPNCKVGAGVPETLCAAFSIVSYISASL